MHWLSDEQNRQESLKFHTRALGDNQGCLSVDVSFIFGLDAKMRRTPVKNRPLVYCYLLCLYYHFANTQAGAACS